MDFSNVSDEQLLELIKAAMNEAVRRGAAIAYAANETYVDAQRELQIKAEAAAKAAIQAEKEKEDRLKRQAEAEALLEANRRKADEQAKTWARKAAVIHALKEFLAKDCGDFDLNIWQGQDVRVYIQQSGKRNGWEIIYYATGNRYNPPGSVSGLDGDNAQARLSRFCEKLVEHFAPGLRLNSNAASNVKPDQKLLEIYRQALAKEIPANV